MRIPLARCGGNFAARLRDRFVSVDGARPARDVMNDDEARLFKQRLTSVGLRGLMGINEGEAYISRIGVLIPHNCVHGFFLLIAYEFPLTEESRYQFFINRSRTLNAKAVISSVLSRTEKFPGRT